MNSVKLDPDLHKYLLNPNYTETEMLNELRYANHTLERDLEIAISQAEEAKKDSRFSKRLAMASFAVSLLSVATNFLPYIFF